VIAVLQPITPEVAMRSIWHQQLRTRGGHADVFQLGGRPDGVFVTSGPALQAIKTVIDGLHIVSRVRMQQGWSMLCSYSGGWRAGLSINRPF